MMEIIIIGLLIILAIAFVSHRAALRLEKNALEVEHRRLNLLAEKTIREIEFKKQHGWKNWK